MKFFHRLCCRLGWHQWGTAEFYFAEWTFCLYCDKQKP